MQPDAPLTFPRFREKLERVGCRCSVMATYGEMIDADGTPTPALFVFERTDADAGHLHAVVHVYDPEIPMAPSIVRSTCAALELDPNLFGL